MDARKFRQFDDILAFDPSAGSKRRESPRDNALRELAKEGYISPDQYRALLFPLTGDMRFAGRLTSYRSEPGNYICPRCREDVRYVHRCIAKKLEFDPETVIDGSVVDEARQIE